MSSSSIFTAETNTSSHRAVAPAWHTAVLVAFLLGISALGARTGHFGGSRYGRVGGYVWVMFLEWMMVAFIWYGVRRRGGRLSDLIGGRWTRLRDVFRDLGIAFGFLIVGSITLQGLAFVLHARPTDALRTLFPRSRIEIILWILLSLTAGICEEIQCRGYFQRQFASLTRSASGGIVLQGIVFGAAHGYQGWRMMIVIAVYGIIFGLLAQWRHSLRPGMMAHFVQDGLGGLLARNLMR